MVKLTAAFQSLIIKNAGGAAVSEEEIGALITEAQGVRWELVETLVRKAQQDERYVHYGED